MCESMYVYIYVEVAMLVKNQFLKKPGEDVRC